MHTRTAAFVLAALLTTLNPQALVAAPSLRVVIEKLSDHVDCEQGSATRFVEQELSREEQAFLRRERRRIVDQLLKGKPSRAAAAIFAFLGERRAWPTLRRWFLSARWFYGWESNSPNILHAAQYRDHLCYERAMRGLLGQKKLTLRLTPAEIRALRDEYRRRPSKAVLYLLSRFAPADARALVLAEMRQRAKRDLACLVLHHFLRRGSSEPAIVKAIGRPNRREASTWHYRCAGGVELSLVFSHRALQRLVLVNWHGTGRTLVRELSQGTTTGRHFHPSRGRR